MSDPHASTQKPRVLVIEAAPFKLFNDSYGHAAGDECLRAVGRALAGGAQRASDFVARYGGEEFVIVLPETGQENAAAFAERLRAAVSALAIPHRASSAAPHVTISLGFATCEPTAGAEPAALVESADRMLYAAKEGGRNRAAGVTS